MERDVRHRVRRRDVRHKRVACQIDDGHPRLGCDEPASELAGRRAFQACYADCGGGCREWQCLCHGAGVRSCQFNRLQSACAVCDVDSAFSIWLFVGDIKSIRCAIGGVTVRPFRGMRRADIDGLDAPFSIGNVSEIVPQCDIVCVSERGLRRNPLRLLRIADIDEE